ncbi:MAG TPA: cofactor-independent phosphoglycerate mutase [Chitinispirillaceae bacterium]|nr:cofactor-independent phosphoglycerate mutase [Chitinispirillaceae bacterium]
MKSKYAILVGDGMADYPIPELGNITPLAYARTPNMDSVASRGRTGLVSTVPNGMQPGSDVANLSLLGYDPLKYYSGRAPIEAASMGISLSQNETAFRCNLVTIENNRMVDYSAGHIDTEFAREIICELQKELGTENIRFFPGISYRHLVVISDFPDDLKCTPPHDITGCEIMPYLPKGSGQEILNSLMQKAVGIISGIIEKNSDHHKKSNVTDIWLWGQGRSLTLPTISQQFGLNGTAISAVDLVKGLGVLAGLDVPFVKGATGYLGTNYAGKIEAALKAFETQDFVYLHVEAPDETSHQGALQKKIQAIEEFDTFIVGEMLKYQKEYTNLRILISPDHATPVSIKTHSSEPVPYTCCGPEIGTDFSMNYSEMSAKEKPILTGPELFRYFIQR